MLLINFMARSKGTGQMGLKLLKIRKWELKVTWVSSSKGGYHQVNIFFKSENLLNTKGVSVHFLVHVTMNLYSWVEEMVEPVTHI